jgi:hypothetical protein
MLAALVSVRAFLFKMLGNLVHEKGTLYLNVKGVDVGSIFSETVFDTGNATQERTAIDSKIMQGNNGGKGLRQESIEILQATLGDAFVMETGEDGRMRTSIQWDNMRVSGGTVEQQRYQAEIITQALRQVCALEGIKTSEGGIQIGITTRDGIAIRAMDPNSADFGRPILLDELNANAEGEGSLEKLFEYIAFLADPKVPSIELTGGKNKKMVFHRRDLPPTFRLNFTANPNTRGMSRGNFDRALTSRFGVQLDLRTVPDQDASDYADRIAAYLVGAPLMQLYHAGYNPETDKNIYDEKPEMLTAAVNYIRNMAKTDIELATTPPNEALNTEIAPRIMQMAEQMGNFFDSLGKLLSPDSDFYKQGTIQISPEYEAYLREIQIDLRLPTKLIEKAGTVDPEVETPDDFTTLADAFAGAFADEEDAADMDFGDLMADRGKRLETFILDWLKQVIIPADAGTRGISTAEARQVLDLALKEAADNGIGGRDLRNSSRGGVTRISDLFDVDRFESEKEQARIIRDTLLQASDVDAAPSLFDQIMSVQELTRLSREVAEQVSAGTAPIIARTNADAIAENPFITGTLIDPINPRVKDSDIPEVENLASYEGLMIPVAWKEIGAPNLSRVWGKVAGGQNKSLAMKIAENDADTGIGMTSLLVQKDGAPEIVHILSGGESTLVVSGSISRDFGELLRRQGIIHVDYHAPNATQVINMHLDSSGFGEDEIRAIKQAFLLRNGETDNRAKDMKRSLGEMMTDVENVPPTAPVYVATTAPTRHAKRKTP